jgi:hypothetical protein
MRIPWLARCSSPRSPGERMGNKRWVGECEGRFEKAGVCRRREECKTAGFRKQMY